MNIADSGYNINISGVRPAGNQGTQNIQNQNAAQQPANTAGTGEVSANALISTAKEGQTFNGQILDITNDQVRIMLDNNQTLNARMAEAVNLNIGDSLSFLIKENNGGNVFIKPFNQDLSLMKDSAIFNVLEKNNLSPTEKNYQIAESLMNNGMPVDKGSMQKLMQQSYKFPDASIDTLVNLNKMGLPVNETSISQYNDYVTNSHQLFNDISNINSSILDFSAEVLNNIGSEAKPGSEGDALMQMLDFNESLLGALSDSEDMANITTSGLLNAGAESPAINSDTALINVDASANNTAGVIPGETENNTALTDFLSAKGIDINSSSERLGIDKETLSNVFESLSKLNVNDETLKNIANESKTPLQLLNNINKAISENIKANPDAAEFNEIKQFLNSDEYRKVLSAGVNKKFTLDTNNMKSPSEIDDLYKNMYEKTDKLMRAFSETGGEAGKNLSENAKGMQERIDFMQNLNNMYAYAQIPFRTDTNEANSELFVYMNKKKMNEVKDNISALLHLDMKFLGPTDVHVSLRGNNVHTKFYVEDEESAKIIDEHMTMLENAIKETGHTLTNEVITREPSLALPENMVVNEMFGNELEKSVKRYSFDVRM